MDFLDRLPLAPTNLTLSGTLGEHPALSWDANTEPDIDAYNIYRSTDNGTTYSMLTSVDKNTTQFTDSGVDIGHHYDPFVKYYVTAVDIHLNESGQSNIVQTNAGSFNKPTIDNSNNNSANQKFEVKSVYPNPFNPAANIVVNIPAKSKVKLSVYNMLGKQVALLTDNVLEKGVYNFTFNGSSANGGLASGVYILRLQAVNLNTAAIVNISKKMILTK